MTEEDIVETGRKLAAQMGWEFTVDQRKVRDFRARRAATDENKEGGE